MAKTFKRIVALAMAIALVVCFAVSASAIKVETRTQYAAGTENQMVNVSVTITEAEGANVTYYAQNGTTAVYIDQAVANGGSATFTFQTDKANLNSKVYVGQTENTAVDSLIDAKTISYNGNVIATIPTEEPDYTVTIEGYTPLTGQTVINVDAGGKATVGTWDFSNNNLTIPLTNITDNVVLTITDGEIGANTATAKYLDAAGITVDSTRKFTVLGAATGSSEYGVIITTKEIADSYTEADFATAFVDKVEKFEAITNGTNGVFAVQVIDEAGAEEEQLIVTGETYNVAVYAKNTDGSGYTIAKAAASETVE